MSAFDEQRQAIRGACDLPVDDVPEALRRMQAAARVMGELYVKEYVQTGLTVLAGGADERPR